MLQSLLSRNVDSLALSSDGQEEQSIDVRFLVDTLPHPYLLAVRSKGGSGLLEGGSMARVSIQLAGSKIWLDRMRFAIRFLAPEGIIRQDFEFILQLFAPFQQSTAVRADQGDSAMSSQPPLQDVAGVVSRRSNLHRLHCYLSITAMASQQLQQDCPLLIRLPDLQL